MAFSTPQYDYAQATNQATTSKGLSDVASTFGRFLGQERHRRGLENVNRQFRDRFPKVGQSYQNRGLYNSGLRRQGQQREAEDYQRGVENRNFDFGVQEAGFEQNQAFNEASYQQLMQQLFEKLQADRASGFDPFAGIKV